MSANCLGGIEDLLNQKVQIYAGEYRYCVIICEVCPCYIKAIEIGSGNIRNFNIDRIDYIKDVTP